jgi:hypothetical protein
MKIGGQEGGLRACLFYSTSRFGQRAQEEFVEEGLVPLAVRSRIGENSAVCRNRRLSITLQSFTTSDSEGPSGSIRNPLIHPEEVLNGLSREVI